MSYSTSSEHSGKNTGEKLRFIGPLSRGTNWGVAVYDIETLGKGDLTFYSVGFFDGETYCYFRDLDSFLDHVLTSRYRGYRIFAHYGGRFDVHYVFDYLRKKLPTAELAITCAGCNVIALQVRIGKNYWRFCDSYRLLPASLQTLTNDFDVEHKKLPFDSLSMEYNRHDCLGLYEVLAEFFALYGIQAETVASYAMRVFRSRFLRRSILLPSEEVEDFARQTYCGGRCEVYRWDAARVYHYDVNSLYPRAMLDPVPVEYLARSRRLVEDDRHIGFYRATVRYPERYLPVLPVRIMKLFFPVGRFSGYFTSLELRAAIEDGASVWIHEGRIFYAEAILKEYAEAIYRSKVKAEREEKKGARYVNKLLSNSLYGKFGQRRDQRVFMTDDGSPGLFPLPGGLAWKWEKSRAPHIMPQIASTVTSRSRLITLGYLGGGPVWYTDTDSLFTTSRHPTSDKIGALKLEGTGDFQAHRLKEYTFGGDMKAKGVPRDEALMRAYLAGDEIRYTRIAGFLESVRDGKSPVRHVEVTRRRGTVVEKRARDGKDTRPWNFSELMEMDL